MIRGYIVYPIYYITFFVSIFYLITYFQTKHKYSSKITKKYPFVSVIIPAYNKEESTENSIKSVLTLDYPKDKLELIFVDDGSKDGTYEIAKKLESESVKVFTKENGGKGSALNFGIRKAKGEFIVTLDADTYMDVDFLKKALSYFEDPEVGLVVPTIQVHGQKNSLEKMQAAEYVMSSFNRKVLTFIGSMVAAPACTIFKADLFKKVGLYDENNLTEDYEISLRAQKHNYKLQHLLDSSVYTHVPKTIKSLYRQRLRWNYGTIASLKRHKELFSLKYGDLGIFYLPVFVLAIGIGILIYSLFSYDWLTRIIRRFHLLSLVDFNFELANISFWDFVPGLRVTFGIFTFLFALLLFYLSKKYTKDRKVTFISMLGYFSIFNFFMVVIWVIAIFYHILRKKPTW